MMHLLSCDASRHFCFCFPLLGLWTSFLAVPIQGSFWNVPNFDLGDFGQTFIQGQILPVTWSAIGTTNSFDVYKTLADLWVDGFDQADIDHPRRIYIGVNITVPGSYSWKIDIPSANLSADAKYVFRFKASNPVFNFSNGEIPSPGFLVLQASTTSPSSTSSSIPSSSSSSSSTSAAPATQTSSQSSETATSTQVIVPEASPSGLSSAAKGGIAGGVVAGVLGTAMILGIIYYILRGKRKKQTETVKEDVVLQNHQEQKYGQWAAPPPELSGATIASELPRGVVRTELPGY